MWFETTEEEICLVWGDLYWNANKHSKQNNIYDMMHAWPIRPCQRKILANQTLAIYGDHMGDTIRTLPVY